MTVEFSAEWTCPVVGIVGHITMEELNYLDGGISALSSRVGVSDTVRGVGGDIVYAGRALLRNRIPTRWFGSATSEAFAELRPYLEQSDDFYLIEAEPNETKFLIANEGRWTCRLTNTTATLPDPLELRAAHVSGLGSLLIDGSVLADERWASYVASVVNLARVENPSLVVTVFLPDTKILRSFGKGKYSELLNALSPSYLVGLKAEHVAAAYKAANPCITIVTAGDEDVTYSGSGVKAGVVPVEALEVHPVNTVGAGAIFSAGVTVAAMQEADTTNSIKVGIDLARFALHIREVGILSNIADRETVTRVAVTKDEVRVVTHSDAELVEPFWGAFSPI